MPSRRLGRTPRASILASPGRIEGPRLCMGRDYRTVCSGDPAVHPEVTRAPLPRFLRRRDARARGRERLSAVEIRYFAGPAKLNSQPCQRPNPRHREMHSVACLYQSVLHRPPRVDMRSRGADTHAS